MPATNYTPISLYYSTTSGAAPLAANLVSGELALNLTDGKLYYKDNAGAVQLLSTSTTANGTANGVLYLNGSKVATSGSALVFDGTNLGVGSASNLVQVTSSAYVRTTNTTNTSGFDMGLLGGASSAIAYIYNRANADMVFGVNNAEAMRLTSTGLGIGTSSPAAKLDVRGANQPLGSANGRFITTDLFSVANAGGKIGLGGTYSSSSQITNYAEIKGNKNNATDGDYGGYLTFNTQSFPDGMAEKMRLDSSGNLTIGSTTSVGKLSVWSAANGDVLAGFRCAGTGTQRALYISGDNSTGIVSLDVTGSAAGSLAIKTGGTQTALFDTSGNLGLGVTPSAWYSSYRGLQFYGATIGTHTAARNIEVITNGYHSGSGAYKYLGTDYAGMYAFNNATAGAHTWHTAPSGTAGDAITFTQAMTLDASGNLGIGTTSPTGISNYGAMTINGTNGGLLDLKYGNTLSGRLVASTGSVGIECSSTNYLYFYLNGSERARIDSSGNLLVGKTALAYNTVGCAFEALGTVSATRSADFSAVFNRTTSDGGIVQFRRDNTAVGSISVTASATAYNTSSDYRLKDNQQPLTNSGAFIDALQPKTWNWKADGSRGVGFIAHEVQEISPSSVTGEKDGEQMQAMEYGSAEFIANIIAELQSLRARVAQLESN